MVGAVVWIICIEVGSDGLVVTLEVWVLPVEVWLMGQVVWLVCA